MAQPAPGPAVTAMAGGDEARGPESGTAGLAGSGAASGAPNVDAAGGGAAGGPPDVDAAGGPPDVGAAGGGAAGGPPNVDAAGGASEGLPGPGAPHWLRPAGSGPVEAARAAATVVLLRPATGRRGALGAEVLMLRRTSKVAFGGMWVFPGGGVEAGDVDPDEPDDDVAAARRAAVREAAEEAGLVVPPGSLVPVALWEPPPEAPRRYRTWFFLAPAPVSDVVVDGGEIDHHVWLEPAAALASQAAGEIELAPPTWVTLWRLAADAAGGAGEAGEGGAAADAGSGGVARLLAAAASRPPERFSTRIARQGERMATLWDGDVAYDGGPLDAPGPRRRLWIAPGAWHLEWPGAASGT